MCLMTRIDNRRRTAAILKISVKTASKHLGIAKSGKALVTPNKSRKRAFTKLSVDSFNMSAIESLIYEHRKSELL